ncbi:MAG: carbohydrate binding domain-containing protein [Promethearchaeota archaeon]
MTANTVSTQLQYTAGGFINNHQYFYKTSASVNFSGYGSGTYYVEADSSGDFDIYTSKSSLRTNLNTVVWNGTNFDSVTETDRTYLVAYSEIIDARQSETTLLANLQDIESVKLLAIEAHDKFSNEVLTATLNQINLAINGSFEYWYDGISGALPEGWAYEGTPTDVSRDTGEKDGFGGQYAVKITSAGSGNSGIQLTLNNLKPNTTYTVRVRAKANTNDRAWLRTTGGSSNISTYREATTWDWIYGTFTTDATPTAVVVILGSQTNTDVCYFDQFCIYEGTAQWGFRENPLDRLYKQQTQWINGADIYHSESGAPNRNELDGWENTVSSAGVNDDIFFPVRIPTKIKGKTVVIDQITVYAFTNENGDYITAVTLEANDLDGTYTVAVNYTTDIGNGSSGDVNQDIMTSSYEMTDFPHYIRMALAGADVVDDIKIRGIKIKYHVKAHE